MKRNYILFIFFSIFYFFNIGSRPFATPDEARYVEIPREMVVAGNYVTPRLNYIKYFEKPPLFYWMQSFFIKLFGISEFNMRILPILFGLIGIFATYYFGSILYGQNVGFWSAIVLGTSPLYFGMSHLITLDIFVSVFITLSMYAFFVAYKTNSKIKKRLFFYLFSIFCAFSVLTKGLIGIVIPFIIIFIWCFLARISIIDILKNCYFFSAFSIFLLITVPWHVIVSLQNPEFFHKYFIVEQFLRYSTTIHDRFQPFWFFIPIILIGLIPWSFCLFKKYSANISNDEKFLLTWICVVFVFFSISNSKLIPYIVPLFPPIAILIAKSINAFRHRKILFYIAITINITVLYAAGYIQKESVKPFAQYINKNIKNGDLIASFKTYYQDLPVYTKSKVVVVDFLGELEFGTQVEDVRNWIISLKQFQELKQRTWVVVRNDRIKDIMHKYKIIMQSKNMTLLLINDESLILK